MIIVLGSINIDMLMQVKHFPKPGETVLTSAYEWMPGGKGMNQAVAAARAGAKVAMVGKVGDDGFGTRALNQMRREGILTSGITVSDSAPTGCATIFVDETGENQIVVAQGANTEVLSEQVPDEILNAGNVLLLQMELAEATNWDVLTRASGRGATTILNLAPAHALPREALEHIDYLIVNRIEAQQIAAKLGLKIESDAARLAHVLARNCDLTCIVTLSAKGSVAVEPDGQGGFRGWSMVALDVEPRVDTTGAGDAFCGVFAASLQQRLPLPEALRRASLAGSLSIAAKGAQTAMPYGDDINAHLGQMPLAEPLEI